MAQILIIEDTIALAQGLRSVLQMNGHKVVIALDGTNGLRIARTESPELILLDLMLPDIHGFEILRTLRGEGMSTPVLVLTASGETEARRQSAELGANAFLPKPFQLNRLLAEVEALLSPGESAVGSDLGAVPPANGTPVA
jgi:DNA-binding response OmpR family regulator